MTHNVNVYYDRNGDISYIPRKTNDAPTPYLKKIASLLQNNRTTMDVLAKTPVTKQDLLANAAVTPL